LVIRAGVFTTFVTGLAADWSRVFGLAAQLDKAVEFDCYPDRQDLSVDLLVIARKEGCRISLGTDSHSAPQLRFMDLGIAATIRAELDSKRILNLMPADQLLQWGCRSSRPQSPSITLCYLTTFENLKSIASGPAIRAITALRYQLNKRSGIDTSIELDPAQFLRLRPELETTIFRIVQEALAMSSGTLALVGLRFHSGRRKAKWLWSFAMVVCHFIPDFTNFLA
jgi:hypothetical protein